MYGNATCQASSRHLKSEEKSIRRGTRPGIPARPDEELIAPCKTRWLSWIFPSGNPEAPLRHEDVLSRKIQPKARELGLPHVTWRLLRKWGSTHLIANRLPVNAVQEGLGHSRPDIVLIHYARLLDESAIAAQLAWVRNFHRVLRSWKMLVLNHLAA
jgi:integrase